MLSVLYHQAYFLKENLIRLFEKKSYFHQTNLLKVIFSSMYLACVCLRHYKDIIYKNGLWLISLLRKIIEFMLKEKEKYC